MGRRKNVEGHNKEVAEETISKIEEQELKEQIITPVDDIEEIKPVDTEIVEEIKEETVVEEVKPVVKEVKPSKTVKTEKPAKSKVIYDDLTSFLM